MGHCAVCGCKILELDSNACLGFACERRLCIPCSSGSFGYCPRCKIGDEIKRIDGGVCDYPNLGNWLSDQAEDMSPIIDEIDAEQMKGDEAEEDRLKELYEKLREVREREFDGTYRDRPYHDEEKIEDYEEETKTYKRKEKRTHTSKNYEYEEEEESTEDFILRRLKEIREEEEEESEE